MKFFCHSIYFKLKFKCASANVNTAPIFFKSLTFYVLKLFSCYFDILIFIHDYFKLFTRLYCLSIRSPYLWNAPQASSKSSKRKVLNLSENTSVQGCCRRFLNQCPNFAFLSQSNHAISFSLCFKNLITPQEKRLTYEKMSILHEFILMQLSFSTSHGGPALHLDNLKKC